MFITPLFPEYYIDAPIDNPKICNSNVDLGHAVKMFNMLGVNVDNFLPLGYFCEYDASFDPYGMYLVDAPRKIIWNTFFDFSFDFSMAFGLLKRALIFLVIFIFMPSYSHAGERHALVFDKLSHTLVTYDVMTRVLKM